MPIQLESFDAVERRRSSDAGPLLVYSDSSSESATMPMCRVGKAPDDFT
jgi:hypothetical protein